MYRDKGFGCRARSLGLGSPNVDGGKLARVI